MIKKTLLNKAKVLVPVVLSIVIMVVLQLLSLFVGNLVVTAGLPKLAGNIITAVMYGSLPLLVLWLICRISKKQLSDFGIKKIKVFPLWAVSAFIMPLSVIFAMTQLNGTWIVSNAGKGEHIERIISSIFFFLAVGIVEEAVFRGIIMKSVEKISNKYIAVIAPSLLFGILHIDSHYSPLSCLQVIVAGTLVGILFSLVAYESGSIWSGALMHGIWDIAMSGGIINISVNNNENYIYNYVLKNRFFPLTGGDFGTEASIFAIAAYFIFSLVALILIIKKSRTKIPD